MNYYLLVFAAIILICILLNKWSSRLGIPVLLAFILLGVFMGRNDEVSRENYPFVSDICNLALIFIIFYGGFGTRWKSARPVAAEAGVLATLGVIMTAGLTGVFCHYIAGTDWLMSLLLGSVVSSTDAASVFSILRARKLNLKHNTAPLLEMESGSNDPCAYMLTIIVLSLMGQGGMGVWATIWLFIKQIGFGVACGAGISYLTVKILHRASFGRSGFDSLLIVAIALFAYAIPSVIDGNGFLSVYIVGIVLGNTSFSGRKQLVNFFDGITSFMQVGLFYILGLISTPARMPSALLPAFCILLFLTLIARPATVFALLSPIRKDGGKERKYTFRDMLFVSFVGLRGAASIVFVAIALAQEGSLPGHIFDIIFVIVLLSIGVQGSLIPAFARKTDMIDNRQDVMKTFSDFTENSEMQFSRIQINEGSKWEDKAVKDLDLPENMILALIFREKKRIVPTGGTVIRKGDLVITGALSFNDDSRMELLEHKVRDNSKWIGHRICEYDENKDDDVVVMIKRGSESIIPNGNTVLSRGDVLVIMKNKS